MSGLKRGVAGVRLCGAGCNRPWPCSLHGVLTVVGWQDGTPRASQASSDRACGFCGYHVCACPPPPPAVDVLRVVWRKADQVYLAGDRLAEVTLPRGLVVELQRQLHNYRVFECYTRPEGLYLAAPGGPVLVKVGDRDLTEPRWVTEREQRLDAELARSKHQALAERTHPFAGRLGLDVWPRPAPRSQFELARDMYNAGLFGAADAKPVKP